MNLTKDQTAAKTGPIAIDRVSSLLKLLQARTAATAHHVQHGLHGLFDFITAEKAIDLHVSQSAIIEPKLRTSFTNGTLRRLANSPFYSPSSNSQAPYGYFCGRPIIGDCSPIDGGIYLGAIPQEALVIDGGYPRLRAAFDDFRGRFETTKASELNEVEILQTTLRYTQSRLTLDREKTDRVNRAIRGEQDRKIAIDMYLEAGCGATRHLALLAGYLLEALRRAGVVSGCATIDTSHEEEQLVYVATNGDIFNLDFTQAQLAIGH